MIRKIKPTYSSLWPILIPFMFDHKNRDITIHNGSTKSYNPWDKIQLTKAERKGKSYDEVQAMKKEIYDKRMVK